MAPARMARRVGLCLALVAAAALLVATQPAWSAPPAVRIEVHPLATLTPTRSQLLDGISEGSAAATIAGELRLPAVAAARLPAVLMLHGDAGAVVQLIGDTASEPGPQRIFIGEADVVTAADACVRYAARLREAGADIAVATFAGAHHGFDSAAPGLTRIADFSTAARCNLREVSRGTIVNIDTGKPLAEGDACFGKGLVAGRDAAADSATKGAVKALLIERFGLSR